MSVVSSHFYIKLSHLWSHWIVMGLNIFHKHDQSAHNKIYQQTIPSIRHNCCARFLPAATWKVSESWSPAFSWRCSATSTFYQCLLAISRTTVATGIKLSQCEKFRSLHINSISGNKHVGCIWTIWIKHSNSSTWKNDSPFLGWLLTSTYHCEVDRRRYLSSKWITNNTQIHDS